MVQRRDLLFYATGAVAAGVTLGGLKGLSLAMGPSAADQHDNNIRVDISDLEEGQQITVKFRGKPVFIRHRTQEEVDQARATPMSDLRDTTSRHLSRLSYMDDPGFGSANDRERSVDPEGRYVVFYGICTRLGCVLMGDRAGEYDGWFCPCCAAHYDPSGRIRKGIAPRNLYIPRYEWDREGMITLIDEDGMPPLSGEALDRALYGDG